jgi:hypothetical protein
MALPADTDDDPSEAPAARATADMADDCPLAMGGLKGSTQHFILEGRDGVDAMERGYVRGFDAVAKAELWERWRRGESLKAIGRAFGKPLSSIYFFKAQFRPEPSEVVSRHVVVSPSGFCCSPARLMPKARSGVLKVARLDGLDTLSRQDHHALQP